MLTFHQDTPAPTAILGAGTMGTAIAAAHLRCGLPVILYDTADASLQTAAQRVAGELRIQNVFLNESLFLSTKKLDDIVYCPIIIETIPEKLKVKKRLYQQIAALQHAPMLLFSNTSTLSISLLSEHLPIEWQRTFCGFHFFHPVRQRSLVEIIAGKHTDTATLESAKKHAVRIDKCSIVVTDSPGFLVNRILNPYLSSALLLLEQKVDITRIEQVALRFGMKMGPFRIMDEIGLDVVLHAGWVLHKAFPDRTNSSPILLRLIDQGKLGRKTGQGFMLYSQQTSWEGEGIPDTQFASADESVSDSEIIYRLFMPMYEEAVRCLEERIITDFTTTDKASIEALGFPAERGGIFSWGKGQ